MLITNKSATNYFNVETQNNPEAENESEADSESAASEGEAEAEAAANRYKKNFEVTLAILIIILLLVIFVVAYFCLQKKRQRGIMNVTNRRTARNLQHGEGGDEDDGTVLLM